MLEPREADIPGLFFFLVVLPLVIYILLGKWNEASKKKARINVLAQLAAEEVFTVEAMAAVDVVQVDPVSNLRLHACARCFAPATTRCSRCKSVRYCSGKCQIIHWRQGHKQECQQWDSDSSNISSSPISMSENVHHVVAGMHLKSIFHQNDVKESIHAVDTSDITHGPPSNPFDISSVESSTPFKRDSHKIKRESPRHEEDVGFHLEETKSCGPASSGYTNNIVSELPPNEAIKRHKSGYNTCIVSDSIPNNRNNGKTSGYSSTSSRNVIHENHNLRVQDRSLPESGEKISSFSASSALNVCETETGYSGEKHLNSSTEKLPAKGETKFRKPPYTIESNSVSPKRPTKLSRECPKTCREKESYDPRKTASMTIPAQVKSGISETVHKIPGVRTLQKPPKHGIGANPSDNLKKNKVLFPYEDLVKYFQCELNDVYPRGLLNCGNSCYANAVLQCLTCTKPLLVYLLRGSHSRTCCVRGWCLMCELELHVSMLREGGGPLSPSKVLSNMRNIGCRMGGGNQEDAHEFLRLLVMSMQSICLEGLGGEKEVDPRLQETTLIQQIFGGRLKSKVKCLKCDIESERYENIMDLTLEIHGWVECLEDALTQFTAPEDLDGDNMYRCGRCCAYVKARKQLSIHEAPNILTIVLKRFQSGKYGKINKCVTFPDMLDMIPFMTGTSDSPPLYMLYAVVVHLDTLNASFSGHYVSYVKDLQGTWFRIDDMEVQAVSLCEVMSEGAYMLFYSRSFPRPPRIYSGKTTTGQASSFTKDSMPRPPKSSRNGLRKPNGILCESDTLPELVSNVGSDINAWTVEEASGYFNNNPSRNILAKHGTVAGSSCMDFSDSASSDWSLFTSSDESSFTTESASDSFSIVDYSDAANLDPISSLFSPVYIPEYSHKSTVSCRDFSPYSPKTTVFSESNGFVLDSSISSRSLSCVQKGNNPESLSSGKNCSMCVNTREQSQR